MWVFLYALLPVVIATALLSLAGLLYSIAECVIFFSEGRWLSPVEACALLEPQILEIPWVAQPTEWLGVHIIVTSPFGGPIIFVGAFLATILLGWIGILVELSA